MNAESEIIKSIEECKKMYENYDFKHFNVYFGIDSINSYMENYEISLQESIETFNEYVEIHSIDGKIIEEFPNLENISQNYQIEADENYLIKAYSKDELNLDVTYYFKIMISQKEDLQLEKVAYVIDENG